MGLPEKDVEAAVTKFKAHFPEWRLDSFPGFLGNVTAGRCTNVFNLDGMNAVVDAACASSLVAVKVAIDELLYGHCRTMIAGATCTDCSIGMYMAFSKTPVFSHKQSVTAYDKGANGMLIGEGSVMFVLKRLEHAIADGDKARSRPPHVGPRLLPHPHPRPTPTALARALAHCPTAQPPARPPPSLSSE